MYSDVTRAKWLQLISLASHALPNGDGEGLASGDYVDIYGAAN